LIEDFFSKLKLRVAILAVDIDKLFIVIDKIEKQLVANG